MVGKRAFGEFLNAPIDAEHEAIARDRIDGRESPHECARRIDFDLFAAGFPAQIGVVGFFETLFADDVVPTVALPAQARVLVLGDRPDVAEKMRAEFVMREIAHRLGFEIEAG